MSFWSIAKTHENTPEDRHRLPLLTFHPTRRHNQTIVHANHIHPLLLPKLHRRDIPPELVDFIFDIREDVRGAQMGEDIVDQSSRDSQAAVVGNDMERDIQAVELGLSKYISSNQCLQVDWCIP